MASLDFALTRQALKKGVVVQRLNDQSIAVRLRYIGTGTVTSVTATQATSIELVTSDGGTDTYLFATYTTMGALVDAINADGIFEAKIVDALRSENPDDFFIEGAVTAGTDSNGVVVWDLLTDVSAALTMSVCLSPLSPDFDLPKGHRVHLRSLKYYADLTAAADGIQIWKRKGTVETLVFSALSVDTTETEITFASGEGYITGNPDEEFVVTVTGALQNYANGYVRVVGEYE